MALAMPTASPTMLISVKPLLRAILRKAIFR